MQEQWAAAITERALAHWTDERTTSILGDKQLALHPRDAAVLLRALGLVRDDATMPPDRVRKFLQVDHVVRILATALAGCTRIVDAGCGRSYLTLALAHVLRIPVLGIDRDAGVIDECRRRAALAGLAELATYRVAELAAARDEPADAVVALHACDTATDDAIALGVGAHARVIAVAPCCQAELARAWRALAEAPGAFAPIWRSGHLRREIAAHVTDAMRAVLLRAAGYAVTPMEFVAEAHTAKNTLLRAVRGDVDPAARDEYRALVAATGGAGIALATRLGFSA